MAFVIYEAAVPPMLRSLRNLSKILDKAETEATEKNIILQDLLEARLAPDMHPFTRQIQMVSDAAKFTAARLAGVEAPSYADTETTFAQLQARLQKTIGFLESLTPEQFENAETREIELKFPSRIFNFNGADYLTGFALPHFYFHVTTAYGLLRHKGIGLGKGDFLGL